MMTKEQIIKALHNLGDNAPVYNPFTAEGNRAWSEYADTCRGYEAMLRDMGENF